MATFKDYLATLSFWVRMKMRHEALKRFSESGNAFVLAFFFGFFDATFFYISPMVYFLFTVIFSPLCGFIHLIAAFVGTIAGSFVMYNLAGDFGSAVNKILLNNPGVTEGMVSFVRNGYFTSVSKTFLASFWTIIPIKVYAVQAGIAGISLRQFIAGFFPLLFIKLLIFFAVFLFIGRFFNAFIKRKTDIFFCLYALFWVIFYFLYFAKIRSIY
ncbi:MAG: hypothetical protein HQL27_04405 [Candidatus Omnitrophica bacterium]|nr:hypothetical protein [Candidatus Omnitrophota bacterium]